ncbi:similar to Saccharomyces cerevisiae YDL098C SNU23 Component of U4/U6.U5 snRNP involved in mRNA splicing via spliceosome [Maudiozyma saulgeensis]|uniref:Similar to Saccharomyces cerevisiae YDL098C SNU23 Component of U4/U6.U5 snRNP involved in mRNA splicing via spliceosome n=1 Tax=Maudiozyma saulgeensis TaxID=1789683 RepID=A0A1X7QZZ6_9SACH|nr:similar to Saccharomyces cerevisiae YDL098C SNU23 Component of U4/U6.U5 snRNP involved in mRNA splicing via spliceosome [Kazachstania saulgeensis]
MSDFGRRTWNREDYIGAGSKTETPIFTDVQLTALKVKYSNYDKLMQQTNLNVNEKTLVTNVSSYKKGKQFGFYCDLCDLTFKDTLQYVNHLNHKVHLLKYEALFGESLISDTRDNDDIPLDEFSDSYTRFVHDFVKKHIDRPQQQRNKPRQKKPVDNKSVEENDISKMMGFGSFGSTKK